MERMADDRKEKDGINIILASGSPRRRELLRRCGMEFEILQTDADESYEADRPEEIVRLLSKRKADAAVEACGEREDCIIISADTLVAAGDRILGKPKDRDDAKDMLRCIAGSTHQVYTGVTLVRLGKNSRMEREIKTVTFSEKTDVIVKPLTEKEIDDYASTGECDDKAGAYAIQGQFSPHIEKIEGDYDNVVGLPMKRLAMELRKIGYPAPMPIHMVVSDIDGTLVKDSSPEVYPEIIEAIRELKKKGILFCIASGRQYYSIRHMFREAADDIVYLCENGAHLVYNGHDIHMKEMREDIVKELLTELRRYGKEYGIVISTPKGSYLEHPDETFETLIRESYHNKYMVTEDFLKEKVPCIKIAIYQKGGIRELGEKELIPRWESRLKTCMAGEEWVDFMDRDVDKGKGLEVLREYFGLERDEIMVFGDNANDIGMLAAGGESYAVENAREEVREKAKHLCPGYREKGVYQVIKKRLLD